MARFVTSGWIFLLVMELCMLLSAEEAAAQRRSRSLVADTSRAGQRSQVRTAPSVSVRGQEREVAAQRPTREGRRDSAAEARRRTPERSDRSEPQRGTAGEGRASTGVVRPADRVQPAGASRSDGPMPRPQWAPAVHPAPPGKAQPLIHVDIAWPWEFRYHRKWAPRYQYRQVVFVELGWGQRHRARRIDVRTFYRHRVYRANAHRAEVDVIIDRIELYDTGRYLGAVEHIPSNLGRIRATLYRDGRVQFDREVFLVGDPYVGFEMISTRYYGRPVWDAYHPRHGIRAGVLDLRRARVVAVRRSCLFDPYHFDGYVPVSLLPEENGWLCDSGSHGVSARYYDAYGDSYYYGYKGAAPRGPTGGAPYPAGGSYAVQPLRTERDKVFRTEQGAQIRLKREAELTRLE